MDLFAQFWDLVVHLDVHLAAALQQYGTGVYVLLVLIVFCETGLVVTPFLPGDSLLFAAGALWALSGMPVHWLALALIVAALCGDNVNYWVGRYLGPKVFQWPDSRFFNRRALERTHAFYQRHGGKTIVAARFMPIIRTFVPFVAGVGRYDYGRYLAFCVGGAVLWVCSVLYAGYFFGNIPVIKKNFTVVVLVIVGVSLLPAIIAGVRGRARTT
jgi:membrane-associated protein